MDGPCSQTIAGGTLGTRFDPGQARSLSPEESMPRRLTQRIEGDPRDAAGYVMRSERSRWEPAWFAPLLDEIDLINVVVTADAPSTGHRERRCRHRRARGDRDSAGRRSRQARVWPLRRSPYGSSSGPTRLLEPVGPFLERVVVAVECPARPTDQRAGPAARAHPAIVDVRHAQASVVVTYLVASAVMAVSRGWGLHPVWSGSSRGCGDGPRRCDPWCSTAPSGQRVKTPAMRRGRHQASAKLGRNRALPWRG